MSTTQGWPADRPVGVELSFTVAQPRERRAREHERRNRDGDHCSLASTSSFGCSVYTGSAS